MLWRKNSKMRTQTRSLTRRSCRRLYTSSGGDKPMPYMHSHHRWFWRTPGWTCPPHSHTTYAATYKISDVNSLRQAGVKNINNVLWHVTNCQPQEIVKPDTLHTLYLGIITYLMKCVFDFLRYVGRTNSFDYLWSRLPPYPGFTLLNKAYGSVSQ